MSQRTLPLPKTLTRLAITCRVKIKRNWKSSAKMAPLSKASKTSTGRLWSRHVASSQISTQRSWKKTSSHTITTVVTCETSSLTMRLMCQRTTIKSSLVEAAQTTTLMLSPSWSVQTWTATCCLSQKKTIDSVTPNLVNQAKSHSWARESVRKEATRRMR